MIIGHRGASAQATENTLAAFERAARDGADGVELDVLCCQTGEVVVFHDDDLSRLADRPDRVAGLDLSFLRTVRLRGGGGIPLLDEAFEACGPTLLVNVELKSGGLFDLDLPRLVDGVRASIRPLPDRDRVHRLLVRPTGGGALEARRAAGPLRPAVRGRGPAGAGQGPHVAPAAAGRRAPRGRLCASRTGSSAGTGPAIG